MLLNSACKISLGSLKPVDLICDYCQEEYSIPQRTYAKSHKIINKDACKNCRSKKRKESCLQKYGVDVASKAREVKLKRSDRIVEDYKEEILALHRQGYSVNHISEELKLTRSVLTNFMKSLGLDTGANIVKKTQKTNLERYGAISFLSTEEGQRQLKQAFKDKYGFENPYNSKEYKDKIIAKSTATSLKKYGVEYTVQDPARQEEFNKKRRATRIANGNEVEYDGKTARELCGDIGINLSSFHERVRKTGLESAVNTPKQETYIETIIANLLDKHNIKYEKQFRVENFIADFKIENVLIEVDGLYWHSDARRLDKNYHKRKRDTYIANGFFPLFFREDEVNNKLEIVESIILNKLNLSTKIFARKCKIVSGKFKDFVVENHLMGKGYGSYFGLEYDSKLVAVIQIRRLKNKEYEVSRFCCAKGVSVIGGFSRLLNHVEKEIKMDSLKTFIDLRYGIGDYLEDLGFVKNKPYLSFRWTDGERSFHRLIFRGRSGYDKGLGKIWDCGQLPFIKHYGVFT